MKYKAPVVFGIRRFTWQFAIALVLLVILMVVLFAVVRPAPRQLGETVGLRQLYQVALANPIADPKTTFWRITEHTVDGPHQKICTNYSGPQYNPSTDMYFKKDAVTAWYSQPGYPRAEPLMYYSDDLKIPAFQDDVFGGEQNSVVRTMLARSIQSDSDGNPLDPAASVAERQTGIYDIYGRITTSPDDKKYYVAGCSELLLHIKIDAATKLYTEIAVYNVTPATPTEAAAMTEPGIRPANLSFAYKRTVETSAVTFDQALPVMEQAGFDMETAQKSSLRTYAYIVNDAAGFQLDYLPGVLGEPILKEIKSPDNILQAYEYTFSRHPEVTSSIRTTNFSGQPNKAADLKAIAVKYGWNVTFEGGNAIETIPGCKPGDTEYTVVANDGRFGYLLTERTCGPYPSVYTVAPLALTLSTRNSFMPNPILYPPIAGFITFEPGTKPPRMH